MKNMLVAELISRLVENSGKSQRQIAKECGYVNPNMITMIKTGRTRLPLSRVPVMARALNVAPEVLLGAVMSEYNPETWEVVRDLMVFRRRSSDEPAGHRTAHG